MITASRNGMAASLVFGLALGSGVAGASLAGELDGPTTAIVIEGSGFFASPGIEIGRMARVDLLDPSIVTPLGRAATNLRFGGGDVRPGTGEAVSFDNSTNALRVLGLDAGGNTLIDSVGFHESGVAGMTYSNDGSRVFTTTNVGGFGRIVEAEASTGAVVAVTNIINIALSSLATAPEGEDQFEPGTVVGLGLSSFGGLSLIELDLDAGAVARQVGITGIGFQPQFETGLDWAADGTLYALIQGFEQLGPDLFVEISSHLYTIDPQTGVATLVGVVQADATWDAVTLILEDGVTPEACPADINLDGQATAADFTAWLFIFGNQGTATPEELARADVNNDGSVTSADFTAWLAAFNVGCGG